MNVILSIKPKYVDKIVHGSKKYEFRKTVFRQDVEEILIYESAPTKKIIGVFTVGEIIIDTPPNLWKKFNGESGIDKRDFFNYYNGSKSGCAIRIINLKVFNNPIDPKSVFPGFTPPQSFTYVCPVRCNDI